jgi:four helix bundle protein
LGSQAEVEVQIEVARRLGFINESRHRVVLQRVETVGKLLNGLIDSLERE